MYPRGDVVAATDTAVITSAVAATTAPVAASTVDHDDPHRSPTP
jgi:hypothetical protein